MRWKIIAGLVLIAATLAAFSPVWNAELVQWDDDLNIYGNPHIQKLDGESLRWMFTDCTYTPRYRPLNWLAWATLYHFFGANGGPYHIALLVLHAINSVLLFVLLLQLIQRLPTPFPESAADLQSAGATGNSLSPTAEYKSAALSFWPTLCAFSGALIWAIHPLRTEVVGWANCQMYTQSLFFLLISLLCYLRVINQSSGAGFQPATAGILPANPTSIESGAGSPQDRPDACPTIKSALYWLSILCFLCSLLTYPTAIGLLAVLFAMDIWFLHRLPQNLRLWKNPDYRSALIEKIPFLIVTLLVAGITLWARLNATAVWDTLSRTENFGWDSRLAQAAYIWTYFLWKPLWPTGLSPVYTQLVTFKPTDWPFLVSIATVLGLTILLFLKRHRWPGLLALWFCHLALLVPMLGLTDHPHYPNDRYSYIVGLLWAVLITFGLWKIKNTAALRVVGITTIFTLATLFATLSFHQSHMWKNSVTLFETVIAKLGENKYRSDTYWRLGLYHVKNGNEKEAMRNFTEAAQILPGFPQAHNDMAAILFKQGKLDEAIAHYEEALRYFPKDTATHKNFGIILAQQGKFTEAIEQFEAALKSNPNEVSTHINIAFPLSQTGRVNEAFEHIFTAVKLDPKNPEAQFYAGNACMNLQKVPEAIQHFQTAAKLKPDYADAHFNLGNALAASGKVNEALPHFLETAQLNPAKPEALLACGMALAQTGKKEEALQKYKAALHLAQTTGRNDLVSQIQSQMQSLNP